MKVILQGDIKNVGKKGDVINVSDGYARNFLFPKKLAVEASQGNMQVLQKQKDHELKKQQEILEEAKKLGAKLSQKKITLQLKAGEGGKLFGSVATKDIADALTKQHGIELDKRKIELKEALKTLGSYPVSIKLHPEVTAQVTVSIIAQ